MTKMITGIPLDEIYIPNTCSGEITVSANIHEVSDKVIDNNTKQRSYEFSSSYTAVSINGGDTHVITIEGDLDYIPAFYSNGNIVIHTTVGSTDDLDGGVDLLYDAVMYISQSNKPSWYPYDTNYDSDVMTSLITSPKKDAVYSSIAANTSIQTNFSICSWTGIRPILRVVNPNEDNSLMGCLPSTSFRITIKNNLSSSIILSNVTISVSFSYSMDSPLMQLGNKTIDNVSYLYPGPKYVGDTNLWTIIDGYEPDEVIKVFGYFYETINNKGVLKTVSLLPVEETGGSNHAAIVWKSAEPIVPEADRDRILTRGLREGEKALVITPAIICQDSHFKNVVVLCKKRTDIIVDNTPSYMLCSPSDEDAIFFVKVVLNKNIEEATVENGIEEDDFNDAISRMFFFNVDTPFLPYDDDDVDSIKEEKMMQVKRKDISDIFYDTLGSNYEESVILVSVRDDIEPRIEIKINSYKDWIPIYNNKAIRFSESLMTCTDGVRSRDIWFFGEKSDPKALSNTIKINDNPDIGKDHRYDVSISVSYMEYKSIHIHEYIEEESDE